MSKEEMDRIALQVAADHRRELAEELAKFVIPLPGQFENARLALER